MSEDTRIDPETQAVVDKNTKLLELTSHHGWKEARKILIEKILSLQNVAEYVDVIQAGNATKLLKEMKANARAAEILFDFLRQIEGGAQAAVENKQPRRKSFIVNLEDES